MLLLFKILQAFISFHLFLKDTNILQVDSILLLHQFLKILTLINDFLILFRH